MAVSLLHLHTYFLFPFSIDRETVAAEHAAQWKTKAQWIDGLDEWVNWHATAGKSPLVAKLGCWQRAAYARADMDSPAYQDMIFFHPFVRRVFFDISDKSAAAGEREALIRCYRIPLDGSRTVWYRAEDARGRRAAMQVTDLRLFLFANGMGILSLGVEARNISAREALWINEQMRKIYPSSGRQLREGRAPNRYSLSIEENGQETVIAEENFESCSMIGFQPPLSKIISALLYFLDYEKREFEQLLDERMIVYTHTILDPASVPADFARSEACQHFLSGLLYVDHEWDRFRYDPEFTREQLRAHLYTRWAHEGTWFGFTSYSNITATIGVADRGEHVVKEGDLIHRMFDTRYYLMAIVALFYRATLLDFAQKTALVSRNLFHDQERGELSPANVQIARALRAEYLHFSNHWFFDELANKDEETEHFEKQCRGYRVGTMRAEVEQEIEKMNASLNEYYQNKSTEAVNRLAMVSMILGAGAVITGFFGMNFGREFHAIFFEPEAQPHWIHYLAIAFVSVFAFGAVAFGIYLVWSNPAAYRDILVPAGTKGRPKAKWFSFKRRMK
jgi:hypothetical protein